MWAIWLRLVHWNLRLANSALQSPSEESRERLLGGTATADRPWGTQWEGGHLQGGLQAGRPQKKANPQTSWTSSHQNCEKIKFYLRKKKERECWIFFQFCVKINYTGKRQNEANKWLSLFLNSWPPLFWLPNPTSPGRRRTDLGKPKSHSQSTYCDCQSQRMQYSSSLSHGMWGREKWSQAKVASIQPKLISVLQSSGKQNLMDVFSIKTSFTINE